MSFFDEETTKVLLKFLDRKAKEAEEEIATKGILSEDKAIPLILKIQFNHIAHLDYEISRVAAIMDEKFKELDSRFEKIDERFERIEERFQRIDERFERIEDRFARLGQGLVAGFTILGALMAILRFVG